MPSGGGVMQFRKFILALMLVLGAFAFTGRANAQAQQQPPAGGSTWGTGINIFEQAKEWFGSENADEDNTQKSYEEWKQQFQNPKMCWGCTLFDQMAGVTMDMGENGTKAFSDGASKAVSAFMGLWVVWQLYLMLSITHANSPAQSIDTIFNRLVVMMVVLFLLRSNPYNYIMEGLVFPTMGAVMSAAGSLLSVGGTGCGGGSTYPFVTQGNRLLCGMHNEMAAGIGLGAWLIDGADFQFWLGKFEILRAVGGAIIMLVFCFMMIIMPFRFFDALVRIATVSAILPIIVVAYLFKPTRGACKQAATSILASILTFVFTSIAIAIAVNVLNRVARPIIDSKFDASTTSAFGPVSADQFMVLITAALGMAVMILQSGGLAAEFAGFQGNMGGAGAAGAAAATAVTTAGVGMATGGATTVAAGAARMGGRGMKSGAGALVNMARSGGGGGGGSSGAGGVN